MSLNLVVALATVLASIAAAGSPSSMRYFPGFHVRPPTNWINDPNGPMYDTKNDRYHLWMQYNPEGATWGNLSWYHVASDDLVTFDRIGVTLRNDASYDAGGVFSGSATVSADGDTMVIMYTCVDSTGAQRQCMATPEDTSDPDLSRWNKLDANPVIAAGPGHQNGRTNFRDPTTAWVATGAASKESAYTFAVGTSVLTADGTTLRAAVALYNVSTSLTQQFAFSGYLYSTSHQYAPMIECPDYYDLPLTATAANQSANNNDGLSLKILKTSVEWVFQDFFTVGTTQWSATLDGVGNASHFVPCDPCPFNSLVDYGNMYASKSFWDSKKKRRVMWGWISEDDEDAVAAARGWQGMQSVPRQITADFSAEGAPIIKAYPIPEFSQLREAPPLAAVASPVDTPLSAFGEVVLCGANCTNITQLDMEVTIAVPTGSLPAIGDAWRIGVTLLPSTAGSSTFAGLIGAAAISTLPSEGCVFDASGALTNVSTADSAACQSRCVRDGKCSAWSFDAVASLCVVYSKVSWAWLSAPVTTTCGFAAPSFFGIDRRLSGTTGSTAPALGPATVVLEDGGDMAVISLRVLVDNSVVEAYLDHGVARATARVYNMQATGTVSVVAQVRSSAGDAWVSMPGAVLRNASVWQVRSAWNAPVQFSPPNGTVAIIITAAFVLAFIAVFGAFAIRQLAREAAARKYATVAVVALE